MASFGAFAISWVLQQGDELHHEDCTRHWESLSSTKVVMRVCRALGRRASDLVAVLFDETAMCELVAQEPHSVLPCLGPLASAEKEQKGEVQHHGVADLRGHRQHPGVGLAAA